jgi:hypothetical protein
VRLVTQIESIRAVAIAIAEREGADRDRQHFERGLWAAAGGFAGEHSRDVGFKGQRLDRVAAASTGEADAQVKLAGIVNRSLQRR